MHKNRISPASADPARALKKAKGFMIFGLKSWVKALELADGNKKSAGKYRYAVTADASSGHIFLAENGTVVEGTERSRDDWAKIGQPARLASIALRAAKDELNIHERVEYTFNVITGEAFLSRRGQRVAGHPGDNRTAWAEIGHPDRDRALRAAFRCPGVGQQRPLRRRHSRSHDQARCNSASSRLSRRTLVADLS